MKRFRVWVCYSPIVFTAFLGFVDIISAASGPGVRRGRVISLLFSHAVTTASRGLVLVTGFLLLILTQGLLRRARIAWQASLLLTILSLIGHIGKGFGLYQAALPLLVMLVLLLNRSFYTRLPDKPTQTRGIWLAAALFLVCIMYGTLTLHFSGRHSFGERITWSQSFIDSLKLSFFFGDAGLTARTVIAKVFLGSFYTVSSTAWLLLGSSLLLPVFERLQKLPSEHAEAVALVSRFGTSSLDIFKLYWDKSYFFSVSRKAFLAYRVVEPTALVLGDAVGDTESRAQVVDEFMAYASKRGWRVAFQQSGNEKENSSRHSFRRLKIGEEAVVLLAAFSIEGRAMKDLRTSSRRLQREGFTIEYHAPPLTEALSKRLADVSSEWLTLPSRTERIFAQGIFTEHEIKATPVMTLERDGNVLAFISLNIGYAPQCVAIDLLRRRVRVPNGSIDVLVAQAALLFKEQGFQKFSLGLAPLSGLEGLGRPSLPERTLKLFYENVDSVFSYQGLREFKAKFGPEWQPRYLLYQHSYQLPSIGLALLRASRVPAATKLKVRFKERVADLALPQAQ